MGKFLTLGPEYERRMAQSEQDSRMSDADKKVAKRIAEQVVAEISKAKEKSNESAA